MRKTAERFEVTNFPKKSLQAAQESRECDRHHFGSTTLNSLGAIRRQNKRHKNGDLVTYCKWVNGCIGRISHQDTHLKSERFSES